MGEFDTAAFTDLFVSQKSDIRTRIKAVSTIKARLKTRCLNYAIGIERQLELQKKGQGFLEAVQNDVHNYFKAHSDDVFVKLQKAAQLAASTELEDFALLLTEVRRALKASADYFYPAVPGNVMCADGIERALGDEQYLNRLHEFVSRRLARSTSRDLLAAELEHLATFFRRLNDMASKGVHGPVTLAESKQGWSAYTSFPSMCVSIFRKMRTDVGANVSQRDSLDDDDDVPWASPEIKANYEAALGRFILAFNQLDNLLTEIIETVLRRLKRDDLVKACSQRDFSNKLLILDLLKSSTVAHGIKDVSVVAMRTVAGERNKLAHGHFDQNPFDGSYDVVSKNIRSWYSVEMLDGLADKANGCFDELRYSSAYYEFSDDQGDESDGLN